MFNFFLQVLFKIYFRISYMFLVNSLLEAVLPLNFMNGEKKMTKKRWVAIGLSIVVFIISLVIPAIGNSLKAEDPEENKGNMVRDFYNDARSVTVIENGDPTSRIAVLDIEGTIVDQEVSPLATVGYNHQKLLGDLEAMKTDDTIKAIILRINSPGGGVYESAELTDKIEEVKEARDIPVYTVMENMAASGGYYIAAHSEKIFAQTETITGSIGVIMQGFNVSELLDKLGIEDMTIKSGDLKDLGSITRESTSEELAVLQELVDNMYERFVDTVESGRDLSREEIYALADGRIYDGEQALENGLVDELGYFDDALLDLRNTHSLENAQVISFQRNELDWFNNFFVNFKGLMPRQNLALPDISTHEEAPQFMYVYRGL